MINFGSFRSRDCHGPTRRAFVKMAAAAPFALCGLGARSPAVEYGAARAKSVIMVWLWGGPSQLDTFDPKPNAPSQYRGPFQPIATRTPSAHFSELLPRLAARSDQFAVVRSCKIGGNDHTMTPLTGYGDRPNAVLEPNFGSIVARHKKSPTLPSFISVAPATTLVHGIESTKSRGFGGGRLGTSANPFIVQCDSLGKVQMPSLDLLPGMTPQRLADRRVLQSQLDDAQRSLAAVPGEQWDKQVADAFNLLTAAGAARAFELEREPREVRDAYGHTTFGQSLLLGRRLVEAGVPYVQVNWSLGVDGLEEGSNMGWDTHRNGFGQLIDYHGPVFDRAMSSLLDDLRQRGLFKSTLVVAMGEMGRTPMINNTGGRDHWSTSSTLWAGGGVEGGRIVGETDAKGAEVVTRPVTALMAGTTIAELMGMSADVRAQMKVLDGGRIIDELF